MGIIIRCLILFLSLTCSFAEAKDFAKRYPTDTAMEVLTPTSSPSIVPQYWSLSGSDIYNNNAGNVGIGTSTPQGKLAVENNTATNTAIFKDSIGFSPLTILDSQFGGSIAPIGSKALILGDFNSAETVVTQLIFGDWIDSDPTMPNWIFNTFSEWCGMGPSQVSPGNQIRMGVNATGPGTFWEPFGSNPNFLLSIDGTLGVGVTPSVEAQYGIYALDIYDVNNTGFDIGDSTNGSWYIANTGQAYFGGGLNITGVTYLDNGAITTDGSGNLTSASFITTGGTSSQFVKGDGSLDSLYYPTAYNSGLTIPSKSGNDGKVLGLTSGSLAWVSGGSGSSQWTTSGSDIYYNTGKVSVGTTSPFTIYGGSTPFTSHNATTGSGFSMSGAFTSADTGDNGVWIQSPGFPGITMLDGSGNAKGGINYYNLSTYAGSMVMQTDSGTPFVVLSPYFNLSSNGHIGMGQAASPAGSQLDILSDKNIGGGLSSRVLVNSSGLQGFFGVDGTGAGGTYDKISFGGFGNSNDGTVLSQYNIHGQAGYVDAIVLDAYGVHNGTAVPDVKIPNKLGIGIAVGTAPSAKIHAISTTEQLRLGYDASNYLSATIGSTGSATFALTGTTPTFTFSQAMKAPTYNLTDGSDKNYTLSVYSAGTNYSLTVTPALMAFGTTSPSLTIDKAGTYLITAYARVLRNNSSQIALHTITFALCRTNNTAAYLTNGSTTYADDAHTSSNENEEPQTIQVIYTTANTNDIIQFWGSVSSAGTGGTHDVDIANIIATRLY